MSESLAEVIHALKHAILTKDRVALECAKRSLHNFGFYLYETRSNPEMDSAQDEIKGFQKLKVDTKSAYPTDRPPFFAQKVIRKMVKTCAASEMGQTAFMLVAIVATTEDAAGYTRPITFFNDALLPLIGVRKWDTLDRARKAAVEAGWLEYEAPANGKRTPGRYWVKIPAHLDGLNDSPVDEETIKPYPANGDASEKAYPINGDDPRKAYTQKGYASEKAYPLNGEGMGEPSSYTYTKKEEKKVSPSVLEEKQSAKGKRSKSKKAEPDFDPLAVKLPFESDTFREAWSDWVEHRAENKKWTQLIRSMVKTQLKQMAKMGEQRAIGMIEHTVSRGWCGLREPDNAKHLANSPEAKQVDTSTAGLMASMAEKGGIRWDQ